MVQLSTIRSSCIATLCVSLESFAAITLCVASQRVFFVVVVVGGVVVVVAAAAAAAVSLSTHSGNFWIYPHMPRNLRDRNNVFK
jgi:hypothetical protein